MSYYPTQGSYAQPVYTTTSHRGHGYHHSHAGTGYYEQPHSSYGGNNVVYVPGHAGTHRSHRHHSSHGPTVISGGHVVTTSSGRHRRHHRDGHRSSHHLSFGERIARFFGFGRRHYRHKSSDSSWGFLGRSRRRKYVDARTGAEVDRHGRHVYRV